MPTDTHQAVLQYLYLLFRDYLKPRGGVARVAAIAHARPRGHVPGTRPAAPPRPL